MRRLVDRERFERAARRTGTRTSRAEGFAINVRLLALLALALSSIAAPAATAYHMASVMLLQPGSVLNERVPSVQSLSEYIQAGQRTAETALVEEQVVRIEAS